MSETTTLWTRRFQETSFEGKAEASRWLPRRLPEIDMVNPSSVSKAAQDRTNLGDHNTHRQRREGDMSEKPRRLIEIRDNPTALEDNSETPAFLELWERFAGPRI